MTAPFTKLSVVLTSEQGASCMDVTSCAFSQAMMPSFYAFFTSMIVGVVIAASILLSVGVQILAPLAAVGLTTL